jgi:hypothetical protein
MFQWINKQGVTSSEGFTVQRMHRHYYHYVEGDHVVRVMVEPCRDQRTGQYYEIVAEDSFSQWQPPFENEPLASERVEQIRQRFFDALKFMEIEFRAE